MIIYESTFNIRNKVNIVALDGVIKGKGHTIRQGIK